MSNTKYIWWVYVQNMCYKYPQPNRTTKTQELEFQAVSKAIQDTDESQLALLRRCLIGRKGSVKATAEEMGIPVKTALHWQKIFILTVAKHYGLID